MNLRKIFAQETGAVIIEAAIALPMSFALLFVFQDALVVTYNMVSMRFAVEEGLRVGSLGPQCQLGTCQDFEQRAVDKATDIAKAFGVYDSYGFMHNQTTLYDVTSESGTIDFVPDQTDPATCTTNAARADIAVDSLCRISLSATKEFRVSPVTNLLMMGLGGPNGIITLRVSDSAVIENADI